MVENKVMMLVENKVKLVVKIEWTLKKIKNSPVGKEKGNISCENQVENDEGQ